ncbi:DUF4236 domain-containing protein [Pasteurella multocida]|uniref:DUF4236 domain-containing protein n=1 Tax=Pasteurella multocida TaxID=747 RepID=A0AAW8VAP4_PASMD|nr:DUF4236 domain-containing protein [Pasteurella multocida]MDH7436192.1 DUF4236 domain-containing protein [Pasteurella multocida]MDH7440008.1 DUF4236 domain-containing protein [Pasteurella multocida]MDT3453436.1 DUF4236 domain-containing protein [Pasteurella multocida]MDY0427565.1 DUF4236 domain-containing protein [Pasteurella multocida]MDY0434056.1 DUF4236 domain-containing protein [Pasteurella multocida]
MARSAFKNPFKFRKRVKIAPGITVNLSKSGVSATVGVKGASVNVGKKGTYLNTGIPGTGIYSRTKISDFGKSTKTDQYITDSQSSLSSLESIETTEQLIDTFPKLSFMEMSRLTHTRQVFLYKFPKQLQGYTHTLIENLSDAELKALTKSANVKSIYGIILISIFFGFIAADRFYLGNFFIGIIKLISMPLGIGVLWWIADIYFCHKIQQQKNYSRLMTYLGKL